LINSSHAVAIATAMASSSSESHFAKATLIREREVAMEEEKNWQVAEKESSNR
jgi:hypothetical protein